MSRKTSRLCGVLSQGKLVQLYTRAIKTCQGKLFGKNLFIVHTRKESYQGDLSRKTWSSVRALHSFTSFSDQSQFALRKCSHSFTSFSDQSQFASWESVHNRLQFALRKCSHSFTVRFQKVFTLVYIVLRSISVRFEKVFKNALTFGI